MPFTADEQKVIQNALMILERSFVREPVSLTSPAAVIQYLKLRLGAEEREHFGCLFLDNQHQLIKFEVISMGTIDAASVYPREVVKAALACNAAACILAHNHPSGMVEPSSTDKHITERLKSAFALIDVRVLDHVIVGPIDNYSFAENGLL